MLCDKVGIIFDGKIISEGKLSELLKEEEIKSYEVIIKSVNKDNLEKAFGNVVTTQEDNLLLYINNEETLSKLQDFVSEQNGRILSIIPTKSSLEDYFIDKIKELRGGRINE